MCPGRKEDKSVKLTRHILKYCSSVTSVKQFGDTSDISKFYSLQSMVERLRTSHDSFLFTLEQG